MFRRPANQT